MRNREAARYARWAAIAAGLVVLAVAGAYAKRALRRAHALRSKTAAIALGVQQQSAQFSFSKVEQNRTVFTIRASHATQFKDQDRALLQDVWITVYGRDGSRNDNIHTRECSYEPDSGAVRCEGEVQIDVANANSAPGKSGAPSINNLEIKTSNLSFNRDTGEASTPAPVQFQFPAGHGSGVGVSYSTSDSVVHVEKSVEFELPASDRTNGMPVSAAGSSLEIHRNEHNIVLRGPAVAREGNRELWADTISVELDSSYHAQRAVAEGHPRIRASEGGAKIDVSASRFEALLNPAGGIQRIVADGNISGERQTNAGNDQFTAAHVELTMLPDHDLVREMTATGAVTAGSRQDGSSRMLKTESLRVTFSVGPATGRSGKTGQQTIESAETLAPATIESRTTTDRTMIGAQKLVAKMGPEGRLDKLFGHGGVEVHRQLGNDAPQSTSAAELAATFGPGGDWNTLDESGHVQIRQANSQATADHANITRATDTIRLDGSPVITDPMSRTTAGAVLINQKSGELHAAGGVTSTYLPAAKADPVGLGGGAAHISADTLSGSTTSNRVTYTGHARLWQDDSVLEADQIDLWRDDKKLEASGHVFALFPQASGPFPAVPGKPAPSPPGPTLWKILAPSLTYWSDQGKAHLEGGVSASSVQGSLQSRTLDVFLDAAPPSPPTERVSPPKGSASIPSAPGGGQLKRVVARGDVVVRQGERRGMADQAEYTAADGKFVLSGGQPTLADAASDTTTGHSLTFFVANDTILIDSQEGSRTLTKHRVEK